MTDALGSLSNSSRKVTKVVDQAEDYCVVRQVPMRLVGGDHFRPSLADVKLITSGVAAELPRKGLGVAVQQGFNAQTRRSALL